MPAIREWTGLMSTLEVEMSILCPLETMCLMLCYMCPALPLYSQTQGDMKPFSERKTHVQLLMSPVNGRPRASSLGIVVC